MKILYLCDEYPPGKHGGIGTSVRLLAREIAKAGHKVIVAGLYGPGYGGKDEFEDDGVKIYRFRRGFNYKWLRDEQSFAVKVSNKILQLTGVMEAEIKRGLAVYNKELEKIIQDNRIDLVEMPDYNDYIRFCKSFVSFPVLSVPVVVKLHGSITYIAEESGKQVPAHILKMEQSILNQAAAVSSVSKYTAAKSAKYFSYPDKIEVLYNGINVNVPAEESSKNSKQVIYTGTIVKQKGIYQLLKAWNEVNTEMPDARLIILGRGARRQAISCLNEQARHTVSFMGHVPTEKLYNYLASSQISVFPSYIESFSLAPLEAMACGTAVINSKRSSGPELIDDDKNGLLVDPDDTVQIASSILNLLNNPETCRRLAEKGKEKVKDRFDIQKIAAQNIEFYNKILSSRQ